MSHVDGVLLLTDHHEASLVAVDAWRACLAAYLSCQNIPMLLVVTKVSGARDITCVRMLSVALVATNAQSCHVMSYHVM